MRRYRVLRHIADVIPGRNAIALRTFAHIDSSWWVSDLPEKGSDFGYTESAEKALPLSPYWQKRFQVQVRDCSQYDSVAFLAVDETGNAR